MFFVVVIGALVAAYYFGSFELRERFHQAGISATNVARSSEWLPRPLKSALDKLYDQIPGSGGFTVEGGELGREESHFLAGQPRSSREVQLLRNHSYLNLFSTADKQSLCVALRLTDGKKGDADLKIPFIKDPRIQNLEPSKMQLGNWSAFSLAPVPALERQHGETGAKEANLFTNLVPMTEAFAQGTWKEVIRQFSMRYPKRFGEIWLYLGPVYAPEHSKLASGVAIPDAFYAIAFDLTEAGGLRSLSLLVPADASGNHLAPFISSISEIERRTGLRFVPGVDAGARESLVQWVSPTLW